MRAARKIQASERGRKGRTKARAQRQWIEAEAERLMEEEEQRAYEEEYRAQMQHRKDQRDREEREKNEATEREQELEYNRRLDAHASKSRSPYASASPTRGKSSQREREAVISIQKIARGRNARRTYRPRIESRMEIRERMKQRKKEDQQAALEAKTKAAYDRVMKEGRREDNEKSEKKKMNNSFNRSVRGGFGGEMGIIEDEESTETNKGRGGQWRGGGDVSDEDGTSYTDGFEEEEISEVPEDDYERDVREYEEKGRQKAAQEAQRRAEALIGAISQALWVWRLHDIRVLVKRWTKNFKDAKSKKAKFLAKYWRGLEHLGIAMRSVMADRRRLHLRVWKRNGRLQSVFESVNRSLFKRASRASEVRAWRKMVYHFESWIDSRPAESEANEGDSKTELPSWDILVPRKEAEERAQNKPKSALKSPLKSAIKSPGGGIKSPGGRGRSPSVTSPNSPAEPVIAATAEVLSSLRVGGGREGEESVRGERFDSMREWLRSIAPSLGVYTESFEKEGFESAQAISCMADEDMVELGIKLGHRRMLRTAIDAMSGSEFGGSSVGAAGSPTNQAVRPGYHVPSPPRYESLVPLEPEDEDGGGESNRKGGSEGGYDSKPHSARSERPSPTKSVRFAPSPGGSSRPGSSLPALPWHPSAATSIQSTTRFLELLSGAEFPVPDFHLIVPGAEVRSWTFQRGAVQSRRSYVVSQADRLKLVKRILSRSGGSSGKEVKRNPSKDMIAEFIESKKQPNVSAIPRSEAVSEASLRHFCDKRWSGATGILRGVGSHACGNGMLVTAYWEKETLMHVEAWSAVSRSNGAALDGGDEDTVSASCHEACETFGITLMEALEEREKAIPGRLLLLLEYERLEGKVFLLACVGLQSESHVGDSSGLPRPILARGTPKRSLSRSPSRHSIPGLRDDGKRSPRGFEADTFGNPATRAADMRAERIKMKNQAAEERREKAEAKARHYALQKKLASEERRKVPRWAQSASSKKKKMKRKPRYSDDSDEEYEGSEMGRLRSLSALAASPYAPQNAKEYQAKEWALGAPGGGMTTNGYERDRRSSFGGDREYMTPRKLKSINGNKGGSRRGSVMSLKGGGGMENTGYDLNLDEETRKLLRQREMLKVQYEQEKIDSVKEAEANRLRDSLRKEVNDWKEKIEDLAVQRPRSSLRVKGLPEERANSAARSRDKSATRREKVKEMDEVQHKRRSSRRRDSVATTNTEATTEDYTEDATEDATEDYTEDATDDDEAMHRRRGEEATARLSRSKKSEKTASKGEGVERRGSDASYVSLTRMMGGPRRLAPQPKHRSPPKESKSRRNKEPDWESDLRGGKSKAPHLVEPPSKSVSQGRGKSRSPEPGKAGSRIKVPTIMEIAAEKVRKAQEAEAEAEARSAALGGVSADEHAEALLALERRMEAMIRKERERAEASEERRLRAESLSPPREPVTSSSPLREPQGVVSRANEAARSASEEADRARSRSRSDSLSPLQGVQSPKNLALPPELEPGSALPSSKRMTPPAIDTELGRSKKEQAAVEYIGDPVYVSPPRDTQKEIVEQRILKEQTQALNEAPQRHKPTQMGMREIEDLISSLSAPVDLHGFGDERKKVSVRGSPEPGWCSRSDCDKHAHPGQTLCYSHYREQNKHTMAAAPPLIKMIIDKEDAETASRSGSRAPSRAASTAQPYHVKEFVDERPAQLSDGSRAVGVAPSDLEKTVPRESPKARPAPPALPAPQRTPILEAEKGGGGDLSP